MDPLWVYRQAELEMIAHWDCFTHGEKDTGKATEVKK